jgi:hypothetical protein
MLRTLNKHHQSEDWTLRSAVVSTWNIAPTYVSHHCRDTRDRSVDFAPRKLRMVARQEQGRNARWYESKPGFSPQWFSRTGQLMPLLLGAKIEILWAQRLRGSIRNYYRPCPYRPKQTGSRLNTPLLFHDGTIRKASRNGYSVPRPLT